VHPELSSLIHRASQTVPSRPGHHTPQITHWLGLDKLSSVCLASHQDRSELWHPVVCPVLHTLQLYLPASVLRVGEGKNVSITQQDTGLGGY
jgi:hypothetical protein